MSDFSNPQIRANQLLVKDKPLQILIRNALPNRNNYGNCMRNTPEHGVIEPNANSQLAGEKFNQHKQCELVYGPGIKICSYMVTI